ncbi:DNA (cytosine-5)-methyltransferase 1 [Pseudomonas delhiensis]|uniref:DNA (cytosine-5-)-methyltransferase n=1 Tax=Pseudomonas delhiensis TaxID=366289 RepID=A0A239NL84_9PSED|nr:DNA (cytosine-5)-methyltransferase 1 [Pseudomonas delhiensis]SNT55108.1 DNA (cytosine-5)-methyltransferase 1 [Pseudomonas delhiensis]
MTKLAREVLLGIIAAPLILVGGTPCQDFSVAGMRAGLAGERGALTIKFVKLADAIDHVRPAGDECVVVWENVPGVLSDKKNAFGCFLGALVGESEELQPPGGKWKDAGCVYGPKRAAAWRVLDAQYFGLAQRRRRVFVVASARAGFDAAAVLFEHEGVRRDHPPRRGEGQDVAGHAPFGPALQCGCGYIFDLNLGQWGCPNCEGDEGPAVEVLAGVPAFGGENQGGSLFQAGALTAHGVRNDFASETFCVHGTQDPDLRCNVAHTLGQNNGQENALFVALRGRPGGSAAELGADQAGSLRASQGGGDKAHVLVASTIRRLTPRECERLQGFPDNYTLIPWRGKPAEECPDGPRYKAIGNSKAVPVVRWIGQRLMLQLSTAY